MKIKEILKATAGIAGTINPVLGSAICFINQFLPIGEKLPEAATGDEASNAVRNLPPDLRLKVEEKEMELEVQKVKSWEEIARVHAEVDKVGASTRPKIAMMMAWTVVVSVLPISLTLAYAIATSNEPLASASNNATLVLALIATPTALLSAYFGLRTSEKKSRYNASIGGSIGGGFLSRLFGNNK